MYQNVYYATASQKHSIHCLPTEVLAVLANPASYKSMPETHKPKKHDSHQVLDCQDLARSWNSKTWYDMHDCNNMQATLKLAHDIHDCNDMQDTLKITPEAPGRSHRCAG